MTGAARGIGAAIAAAARAEGCSVAACDRRVRVRARRGGGLTFDVTDARRRGGRAPSAALARPVEAVVANAAIVDTSHRAERLPRGSGAATSTSTSPARSSPCSRPAPGCASAATGRIVAISSGRDRRPPRPGGLRGGEGGAARDGADAGGGAGAVRGDRERGAAGDGRDRERARDAGGGARAGARGTCRSGASRTPREIAARRGVPVLRGASYVTGASIPVDGGISLSRLTLGREERQQ